MSGREARAEKHFVRAFVLDGERRQGLTRERIPARLSGRWRVRLARARGRSVAIRGVAGQTSRQRVAGRSVLL